MDRAADFQSAYPGSIPGGSANERVVNLNAGNHRHEGSRRRPRRCSTRAARPTASRTSSCRLRTSICPEPTPAYQPAFGDKPSRPSSTAKRLNQESLRTRRKGFGVDFIRTRVLIETQPDHLFACLKAGTVSTNVHLRKPHNFCILDELVPLATDSPTSLAGHSLPTGNAPSAPGFILLFLEHFSGLGAGMNIFLDLLSAGWDWRQDWLVGFLPRSPKAGGLACNASTGHPAACCRG